MLGGKQGSELRAPAWVSVLVAVLVILIASSFLLPPFVAEYLRASRLAGSGPREAQEGADQSGDFFLGGGMDVPESAELAAMPVSMRILRSSPYGAAFAVRASGGLPFAGEKLDEQQVKSELGLSLDASVDYFVLFLAAPRFNEYSRSGFPDAQTVLDSLKPQDVRGILERVGGGFSLHSEPAQVANALTRLRESPAVLESSP